MGLNGGDAGAGVARGGKECKNVKRIRGGGGGGGGGSGFRSRSRSGPKGVKTEHDVKAKKKIKSTVVVNVVDCKYESVRQVVRIRGWKLVEEEDLDNDEGAAPLHWNIYWIDTSVSSQRVMQLKRYQRINHFPMMSTLARKGGLSKNLTRLYKFFKKEYNFFPRTWVLPREWNSFKKQFTKKRNKTFIVKPDASCQGKGIFLTRTYENVNRQELQVAQRYIHKPLLIENCKFDMRIYVVVTACDPLRIFMFHDGLVRICTNEYVDPCSNNLDNLCMHLTNYSINKHSDAFIFNTDSEDDGVGNKRSLVWFRRWLQDRGEDPAALDARIDDLVIKSLISVQPVLAHTYRSCKIHDRDDVTSCCFEILGFDILIDQKLKPWLIEVNHAPSLTCDTPLDASIKHTLIDRTLSLLNVSASDKRRVRARHSADAKSRLYGVEKSPHLKSTEPDNLNKRMRKKREKNERKQTADGVLRRIYPINEKSKEMYGIEPVCTMNKYAEFLEVASSCFGASATGTSSIRRMDIEMRMGPTSPRVTSPSLFRPASKERDVPKMREHLQQRKYKRTSEADPLETIIMDGKLSPSSYALDHSDETPSCISERGSLSFSDWVEAVDSMVKKTKKKPGRKSGRTRHKPASALTSAIWKSHNKSISLHPSPPRRRISSSGMVKRRANPPKVRTLSIQRFKMDSVDANVIPPSFSVQSRRLAASSNFSSKRDASKRRRQRNGTLKGRNVKYVASKAYSASSSHRGHPSVVHDV